MLSKLDCKPKEIHSMTDAFVKIIRIEGIKSLWSGLPPTLIMAVPTTAIYFTCYDQLCEALKNRPGKHDEHIPVIAGSLSRFGSATVVSPLELIRTQMQYRRSSYKQLYLRISTKVAVDGWFSLWQGWASTILRDVPFSAMYWYNYERFKKMMCKEVGANEPTFFVSFTSGAASGSIAAVVTQPFDVVKTHRQTQLWENETLKIPQRDSKSTWAVMRKIAARNGITGLFAAGEKKESKEEQKKGGREEKLRLDIAMENNDFHCVKFSVMIKHFSWVFKLCLKMFWVSNCNIYLFLSKEVGTE
ncbi:solute carrier family 25 member 40 isoform X3 [Motacilla alba alba]|uniref:solute carrier family 25 member 40 isoform X3 n=1 Tax=Motacilla alba alba TaxID=1094192 RepID=UPI0018D57169|nr:solute carrier family 25 member 40 isoform X3 [Motacilla alba alba]